MILYRDALFFNKVAVYARQPVRDRHRRQEPQAGFCPSPTDRTATGLTKRLPGHMQLYGRHYCCQLQSRRPLHSGPAGGDSVPLASPRPCKANQRLRRPLRRWRRFAGRGLPPGGQPVGEAPQGETAQNLRHCKEDRDALENRKRGGSLLERGKTPKRITQSLLPVRGCVEPEPRGGHPGTLTRPRTACGLCG